MDLYALPPEEFTAARDAAAKQDKALKALRRPTVSAWVVNTLVRREAGLLDELLTLGAALGEAQRAGQAVALRRLGEQRRALLQAVTSRAFEVAGRAGSSAVRGEVESTLEAAMADPASADAVRSGTLVRPLSYSGFGGVDLAGAVAEPLRKPPGASPGKRPAGAVRAAEAAALRAAGALDDAVRAVEESARSLQAHDLELSSARDATRAATDRLAAADAQLQSAQQAAETEQARLVAAVSQQQALLRRAQAASQSAVEAQDAAEAARQSLDRLRREG